MKNRRMGTSIIIVTLLVLFFSISAVTAHQPRLETSTNVSMDNPNIVENPEISQAFL